MDKPEAVEAAYDPMAPPWPFRWFFAGPPSCGKRSQLMALLHDLVEKGTTPDRIIVFHLDPETVEYDDAREVVKEGRFEVIGPDRIPEFAFDSLSREDRTLLIIDEIDLRALGKATYEVVERLFGHGSSHRNTSICLCFQSWIKVPPQIRQACNVMTLFKMDDGPFLTQVALRAGVPKDAMHELVEGILSDAHESLTIRLYLNPGHPCRFSLDLWSPIFHRIAPPASQ